MDAFPALAPTTRLFTVGDVPKQLQTSLSGVAEGYRTGNRRVGQTLSMTFAYLTETQMNLIKNHYFGAKGTYDIFFLSEEIWGDFVTPPIALLDNYGWRYLSTPTITDVGVDRFTLQVELQTIPINTGDLVVDGGLAPASPVRTYILDAGGAAVSPARDYVISPLGAL